MAKEKVREKYKKETGKEPLTKAGTLSTAYKDYLHDPEKCTVPWMANWSFLYKKNKENPYKSGETLISDLKSIDKENREAEKCVIGGIGRGKLLKDVAEFRRASKEKFDIANY